MIENEKYDKFFQDMKDLKSKQEKQKMRGLNDYNMVNVVRGENMEVGMHSNVIYSLINPNGLHYQDDLFLQLFIEHVIEPQLKKLEDKTNNYDGFGNIFDVQAEESTDGNRRIDFTIKSDKYFIGIEMKINANDLENQISDYDKYLKDISKDVNITEDKVFIYYLTKDGKDADPKSKINTKIIKVSFEEHILDWLVACQEEVRNITNLNEAFENYKNIVQKVIGKPKENIMPLSTKILESETNFKIATEIYNEYHRTQEKISKKIGDMIEEGIGNSRIKYIKSFFHDKNADEKPIIYFIIDEKYDIRICSKEFYNFDIFRLGRDELNNNQQNKIQDILENKKGIFRKKYNGLYEYKLKPQTKDMKLYDLYNHSNELDLGEIIELFEIVISVIDEVVKEKL